MGAILSEAQIQSVDDTAEFMRGVQATELIGQSERIARLMVEKAEAEQRELKLANLLHEQQILSSAQDARIRQLEHEVAVLTGKSEPPMPHSWDGFVFPVRVDEATMYCLAQADNTVSAMWISGEWVTTEEFNGPLAFDTLDAAAERWIKAQKQADDDARAEDRARYLEGV